MKQINRLLMTLLALAMVITFSATELTAGGCQPGSDGEGGIEVNPKAPGTKYEGPLTVYYEKVVDTDPQEYILNFFLRLRKGSTLNAFSAQSAAIYLDVESIKEETQWFFTNTVIQNLYDEPIPLDAALLKSVDQLVDEATSGGEEVNNGMVFNILDVVIAVQD